MKTTIQNIIVKSLLLLSLFLVHACNDDLLDRSEQFPTLNPTNIDLEAGSWKPYLLNTPDEFPVNPPVPTDSQEYKREINEVKSFQLAITEEQKKIINYWKAGAVLRWNEIMRTLVAKHNRPPYQNEDGSYPTPSGTNPFAYPQFPFSNPPYAARAFAYVSAAQYDALIAAWYYKKLYNRTSPYTIDNSIQLLVPQSKLPSYPSEDAVVAGVTVELLKLLFPTEIAFISQKADEEKTFRILSGANVRSDIDAGISLGQKVAYKFIARASTDGAGAAIGTPAIWAALETQTAARGEMPWKSIELPIRPPMLPLFGKVKSFLMTPADVLANRPPPPPLTKSSAFATELAEVKNYSRSRSREQMQIVTIWADGVGTYTPPGHWNAIATESFVELNYSEVRWARNMALLNIAMMDAAISCWDAKYTYFNPRPSQVDPSIKTTTGVPNFPAYVSGHSTFSAAASEVLSHIIPSKKNVYEAMATEASNSRLYGAIHYRSDCEKGMQLGKKVAQFALDRAANDGAEN
ncbi:phosphatase PAP2 family protein [Flavobacterium sp.]|uniref:phosphatase PAP2 family protein n=1 Tax=Flavobacterium sp. TaxID=239 RepID=UPI00260DA94D|nr:phosphatase PAP2 family protein [Flavobacterium sp.]MDG2430874.1 phosphatase PAP2 family protein [Flavobacterium sp.]